MAEEEKNVNGNVVPIKKKQNLENGTSKKIHSSTINAMIDKQVGWPKFPVKFHVMKDYRGERIILKETENNVVQPCAEVEVESAIFRYWKHVCPDGENGVYLGAMTAEDAKKTRRAWLLDCKPIKDKILPIAFKSQQGLAWHRLDFDPALPKDFDIMMHCPRFFEFLSRTTNSDALCKWVGSIFDGNSPRQQYIWMYGAGENGKSSFSRVLLRLFGPSGSSEQPPSMNDKFWTCGLVGKRLVIFPDSNNASFITSGLFKTLTGGDLVRIEVKGGAVSFLDLNAKYMAFSNEKPRISSGRADMRRAIYCQVGDIASYFTGNYEDDLWKETPFFISYCFREYKKHLEINGIKPIPTENKELEEIASLNEEDFDNFIEKHIDIVGFKEDVPENQQPHILAHVLGSIMKNEEIRNEKTKNDLRKHILEKTKCKRKLIKCQETGRVFKAYLGIRLKEISQPIE